MNKLIYHIRIRVFRSHLSSKLDQRKYDFQVENACQSLIGAMIKQYLSCLNIGSDNSGNRGPSINCKTVNIMDKKPDINWELARKGVETTTCYTKALLSLYCVTVIDVELVAFTFWIVWTIHSRKGTNMTRGPKW